MKVFSLVVLCYQFALSFSESQNGEFEGIIAKAPEILVKQRTGIIDTDYRWTNNIVPYQFMDLTSDQATYLREVLDEMEAVLCLTFVPRITEANYLRVTNSDSGCSTNIGMIGGPQQLNLESNTPGSGCFHKGMIMSLLMAILGLTKMENASDRDKYVEIIWENILPGYGTQFNIADSRFSQFGVPYDYGSLMHGSATELSANGLPTIVPRDPNAVIGQREKMSLYDIQRIKNMYCP